MERLKYRAFQAPNQGSLEDEIVDRGAAQTSDERILGDSSCISNRNKRRLEMRLPLVESTRTPVLIATNDDLTKVVVLSEQREPKDLLCSANRGSRGTAQETRGCARGCSVYQDSITRGAERRHAVESLTSYPVPRRTLCSKGEHRREWVARRYVVYTAQTREVTDELRHAGMVFELQLWKGHKRQSSQNRLAITPKGKMRNKIASIAGLLVCLFLMPGLASAQGQTSSGTLAVSAELQSSITLSFVSDANGVSLTGSGTNAASLGFGSVSRFTSPPAHVTQVNGATSFTVSTPFDVLVLKSNVTSANYALSAQLQAVDGTNSWTIDTFVVATNPTAPTSLTVTGVYANNVPHTLILTIPYSEGTATISNSINFLATAN
jgi:hypothetical protein